MTEEEAKTKWCPFVRIIKSNDRGTVSDHQAAMNRLDGEKITPLLPRASNCIASACMAWRWSEAKRTAAYLAAVQAHMKATGENFNKATQTVFAERGHEFEHTEGFCGLAGGMLNP